MDLIHSISVLLSTYCTYLGETFTRKVVRETEHQSNTDSSRSVHKYSSRAQQQLFFSYVFKLTTSFHSLYLYLSKPLTLSISRMKCSLSLPPSLFTQIRPVFEKDLSLPKQNVSSALAEGQSYITSPVLTLYVAGVLATFPKVHIQYVHSAENTAYTIGDVFAIMTPNCLA